MEDSPDRMDSCRQESSREGVTTASDRQALSEKGTVLYSVQRRIIP